MSQDDALYPRPDDAYLFQESQVFIDSAVWTGNYDSERSHAQSLQGVGVPSRVLHRECGGGECIADLAAHSVVSSDNEDPAHIALLPPIHFWASHRLRNSLFVFLTPELSNGKTRQDGIRLDTQLVADASWSAMEVYPRP
jgi:hypothetical protein